MTVGERLKERRESANLTLGQVGTYEGVTAQYLSQLETGRRTPNVWALLGALAQRYRTSADYLLGLTDNPAPAGRINTAPGGEPVTELIDVVLDMSPQRRREILAIARIMAKAERGEPGSLDRGIDRVEGGENSPTIIGGE
jgi:transcriptional regulator with XRE-family HTH domain